MALSSSYISFYCCLCLYFLFGSFLVFFLILFTGAGTGGGDGGAIVSNGICSAYYSSSTVSSTLGGLGGYSCAAGSGVGRRPSLLIG